MTRTHWLEPLRTTVVLNGDWERYVHGKLVEVVEVPSSFHPFGAYCLERAFLMPRLSDRQRAILHFDAINYYSQIFVNGIELGSTIPYLPHEFDFTPQAQEGRNTVTVEIVDAGPGMQTPWPFGERKTTTAVVAGSPLYVAAKDAVTFGWSGGWESYGGIIRDAYVEVRPASFIDAARFGYELSSDYEGAAGTARIFISSNRACSGECEVALFRGQSQVATAAKTVAVTSGTTEVELAFDVKDVGLWSPEAPNLYDLRARLSTTAGEDRWACRTGLREIQTQGRDFLLNGKRLVLNGVCRHDMWRDQGFTLSPRQQEQDMRMIKALGANFVRLAHYPHDRRIVELADEIGLLVSEEPGFWNMDFKNMPQGELDLGLKILEGTVRRDWNSPAVAIWLLGNECNFPVSYLKQGKALCNMLDPVRRLVSVAHINDYPNSYWDVPHAKKRFDDAGLDFYDWHAYEFSEEKFATLADSFGPQKPLTLTEWGWEAAGHDSVFYERNFDGLLDQAESGKIAGHAFWSWADIPFFTHTDWHIRDGILLSGVVTETREPRQPIYSRLAALFAGRRDIPRASPATGPTVLRLRSIPFSAGSVFRAVDLQGLAGSPRGDHAWAALEMSLEKFWRTVPMGENQWQRTGGRFALWKQAEVEIVGVPFRSPVNDERIRPLLLTEEFPDLTIPINQTCARLHILGQVTFPTGYPLRGSLGEEIATYFIEYASGKTQVLPVRNGIEVAQSNSIHVATRINPVATAAQPALVFIKDVVREQYQVLLWSIPVDRNGRIAELRCKLKGPQPALAIFALTCEQTADATSG